MSDLGGITAPATGSGALLDILSNPQGFASDTGGTFGSSAAQGALDTLSQSLTSIWPALIIAAAVLIFASSR